MRRTIRLTLELLESRLVLSPATPPTITLDPANDEYGDQIQTVTQFDNSNRVTLGILDTGASPITIAPADQAAFADVNGNLDPVPIKVLGGASGDGIGGSVTGDVSKPVTVLTDGLHAASMDIDLNSFNLIISASFTQASARVAGIQAFIGTDTGSPDLPTISGTPIFAGGFNSSSKSKLAAKVDLINGADFYGIGLLEPDVNFVPSTTKLVPGVNELQATIPLSRLGVNTVASPGDDISSYFNFVANSVQLNNTATSQGYSVASQKFLLDTGSQLTIISTAEAGQLHIDLSKPIDSVDVQGVGGIQTINGYVIDSLQVGLAGTGPLTIKYVPVFVMDAAPEVDGILGMNLWNNVDQMLINPFTPFGATSVPTLSITWDPNYVGGINLGAFGFKVRELLYKNPGLWTLDELLGGAAQYFQVPNHNNSSSLASTPVSTPVTPVSTTVATPGPQFVRSAAPQASLADGPAAVVVSIDPAFFGSPPGTVAIQTAPAAGIPRITSGIVAAPIGSFSATFTNVDNGDAQPVADFPENAVHTEANATDVGMEKPQATNAGMVDQDFQTPPPSGLETNTGEVGAVPTPPGAPLTEAGFLVALGLVAGDYWLPESDERHFRAKIEATRRRRIAGNSFRAG